MPPPPQRPFWSVMIPAYEPGPFLEAALAGVLAQDPGPEEMQIEVIDDASVRTDTGTTVIVVTHNAAVARRVERRLDLRAGRVSAAAT